MIAFSFVASLRGRRELSLLRAADRFGRDQSKTSHFMVLVLALEQDVDGAGASIPGWG